jgi:serine/threonine protein kinase
MTRPHGASSHRIGSPRGAVADRRIRMAANPTTIGRYHVRSRLGHGGMGVVYLALDPVIDRLVAIKLLRVNAEDMRTRFLREAALAGRLQHPNIVSIYDVGEHGGQPFIAMEYVAGETLAELIKRRAPLSLGQKLGLMEDLCSGLAHAHKSGLIHRDIKPSNLVVNREGTLKILDFGIARMGDSGLTMAGVLMGTPSYMCPEQVEGRPVDRRSDVFSVGLVIYELLVYRRAFPGENQHQVLRQIIDSAPEPLTRLSPDLDAGLVALVERAIEKEPDRRYQDLAQLRADVVRSRERIEAARTEDTVVGTLSPLTVRSGFEPAAPTPASVNPPATPGAPATPSTPGRRPVDRAALAQRRAAQILVHLESAREALDQGDLHAAQDAVEHAAVLDPDDPRTVDLLERIREASEVQQARELVQRGREELVQGALTAAYHLALQAQALRPDLADGSQLQRDVLEAQDERERAAKRAHAIAEALRHGEEALAGGALEAALRAAGEALALDAQHAGALAFQARVHEALEARRREEQIAQQAREVIEAAHQDFDAGLHTGAVRRLERATPHPLVTDALETLRRRAADLAAERQREAEEAERQRRERIEAQLVAARAALHDGRLEEAVAVLEAAARECPEDASLAEALTQARARWTDARRRARLDACAQDVRAALARDDLAAAETGLEAARAVDPADPTARDLARAVEAARRALEERRQREEQDRKAHEAVAAARRAFDASRVEDALDQLRRFAPPHAVVTEALAALEAEAAAVARAREAERRRREAAAADEARRAEQRRALAAWAEERLEAIRRSVAERRFADARTALDDLRRRAPDHPAAGELAAEVDREEARLASEQRAAALAAEARNLFERGDIESARARLDEVAAIVPDHEAIGRLGRAVDREIARRRRLEDRARRVGQAIDDARATFSSGRPDEAIAALRALRPQNVEIRAAILDLEREAQAMAERQRVDEARRAHVQWLEEAFAAARAHLEAGRHEAAMSLLDEIAGRDPAAADLAPLRSEVAARMSAAREAADRARRIEATLAAAARELARGDFDAALRYAGDALALDPHHEPALDRQRAIEEARAAAEQARLAAIEETRARDTVERARALFAGGAVDEAIGILAVAPPHELIAAALHDLKTEAARLAEARAEAERQEREAWLRARISAAREALAEGRFDDALALSREARGRAPDTTDLADIEDDARGGLVARRATSRREHATDAILRDAHDHLATGDVASAARCARTLHALGVTRPAVAALNEAIAGARAHVDLDTMTLRADSTVPGGVESAGVHDRRAGAHTDERNPRLPGRD